MWITWLEIKEHVTHDMRYCKAYFNNNPSLKSASNPKYANIHSNKDTYRTRSTLQDAVTAGWWNMIEFIKLYQTQILLNTNKDFLSVLIDEEIQKIDEDYITKRVLLNMNYDLKMIDEEFLSQLFSNELNVWMIHTAKSPLWMILLL